MIESFHPRGREAQAYCLATAPLLAEQMTIDNVCWDLVHVKNLRLPFPLEFAVERGACRMSSSSFSRVIPLGSCRVLPALVAVCLTIPYRAKALLKPIDGGSPSGLVPTIPSLRRTANGVLFDDVRHYKPTTASLSLAVFNDPDRDWTLASASLILAKTGNRKLSQMLLQEGESFRQVVKTQRLTRLFFDALTSNRRRQPERYGFEDQCYLENAFFDLFGIAPDMLATLAGHRRHTNLSHSASILGFRDRLAHQVW